MADPLVTGFHGFDARTPNNMFQPSLAGLMNYQAATPIKKFSPLILNSSGQIEHAAVTGTNEVQSLSQVASPATGGTWTATYAGQTTAAIAYNATAAQIQVAVQALSTIGAGNIVCTGGPMPGTLVSCTFVNALSGTDVAAMTVSNTGLTGGSSPAVVVATTTAGVKGYITSTALYGFSNEWEKGPLDGIYDRSWAQGPIEIDLALAGFNKSATAGTADRELKFSPTLPGNLYSGSIDPTVAVTQAMAASGGLACDLGWDPGNKRVYIRSASTSNVLVKIVQIRPDQLGVYGGVVDFTVLPGKSNWGV